MKYAFAIGTFDGVHRGHQLLLRKLKSFGVPTAVLTFPTHPLEYFRPPAPPLITTLDQKTSLLKSFGVDHVLVLDFASIVHLTYDELLTQLPISHLIRGKGSTFGKGRGGTEETVTPWCTARDIHVEYIPLLSDVSSSAIRAAIASKSYPLAEALLGHTTYERNHV